MTTKIIKTFGIIGNPVAHSLSPLFQEYFARQLGIKAVYAPFHVPTEKLELAIEGLLALGVDGFNVTVPFKEDILPLVSADAEARAIGAVNTVKRQDDTWSATNTDWRGLIAIIEAAKPDVTTALLLGAGGTARAVLHALVQSGTRRIFISNRGRPRLESLLSHASSRYPDVELIDTPWLAAAIKDVAAASQLIINTTSIGLSSDVREFPFRLAGTGLAIDAVYRPDGRTLFVEAATQSGLKAMDGLSLLVAQGAASFHYWHGVSPDRMSALRWLEDKLGREPLPMPGWI
ncbi:MAG: shikimate dehydrogenase family protein [Mariprofundaceae bacterium]